MQSVTATITAKKSLSDSNKHLYLKTIKNERLGGSR